MSACSIHVPPLRQVPSLHKNESMKTEKRDRKFPVYCSCRNNFFDLASDFNLINDQGQQTSGDLQNKFIGIRSKGSSCSARFTAYPEEGAKRALLVFAVGVIRGSLPPTGN